MQYDPLGNMRRLLSPQQIKSALALATRFHRIETGKQGPAIFSFVLDNEPATVSIARDGTVVYIEGSPPQQKETPCQPTLRQKVRSFLRR